MRISQGLATIVAAALLAACGGGGGSFTPGNPGGGSHPASATQKLGMKLIVPARVTHSIGRRPAFVSAATNGATITVNGGSPNVEDLSPGSPLCTVTAGQRTCTVTLTVPVATDTFVITTYDQAPVNGAIPPGAHILGQGTVTIDVISGQTTSVNIFVGGQVANIGVTLPTGSVPANGTAQSLGIVISPTDFGNQPITAGQNDPYANPINVSVTETGGSGHAFVVINGGARAASGTVLHSSDTVTITYDGLGAPGYGFSISVSATGITAQQSQISPLFVALGST